MLAKAIDKVPLLGFMFGVDLLTILSFAGNRFPNGKKTIMSKILFEDASEGPITNL